MSNNSLTGVTSGQLFYDLVVAPQPLSNNSSSSSSSSKGPTEITTTLPELGSSYPKPVLVQGGLGAGGYVSGYFLNKSSTAVLSIPSFSMQGPLAQSAEEAFTNFVQMSKQAGMKKLVISKEMVVELSFLESISSSRYVLHHDQLNAETDYLSDSFPTSLILAPVSEHMSRLTL